MRTLIWLHCLLLAAGPASFGGEPLKLNATLVWGCDEEKPNAKDVKPAPPEVAKSLKGIFKWKHYFVVTNMVASIPENGVHKFVLSSQCAVGIKNDAQTYEAKLHGEGKLLKTMVQKKVIGDNLVLAGDVKKDETAWFVILTPQ